MLVHDMTKSALRSRFLVGSEKFVANEHFWYWVSCAQWARIAKKERLTTVDAKSPNGPGHTKTDGEGTQAHIELFKKLAGW